MFLYLLLLHLVFTFNEKITLLNGEVYRLGLLAWFLPSNKKRPDKIQVLLTPILRQALLATILSCGDSLSTNFLITKANSDHRFTQWAFYFNDSNCFFWICVKQSFIFTTWTSHMHFLHLSSPPVRGQPKGKVKLTIMLFIILCTCSVT